MFHVKHIAPHVLLVNPWITDFAAYNLWVRPLGLLSLASLLRTNGFSVTLIDCLDFNIKSKKYGDGKFFKTEIEKPPSLKLIPRNYSQYGIPEEILLKKLSFIGEKPDLIGVTSGMTYWYGGVVKIIRIIKKFFKDVPIILGGIYATLCYEHAKRHTGADIIFRGDEIEALRLISELTGYRFLTSKSEFQADSYPAHDLYPHLNYICISTSRGCPYQCTYCATPILTKKFLRRDPIKVVEEIRYWTTHYPVKNIAFYDDALLIDPSKHIIIILKELIQQGINCNFHTPNALHIREIDEEVAELLFKGGFKTIRLGFETSDQVMQAETGGKVNNQEFKNAVKYLKKAGYSSEEIGVYIMVGLPHQKAEEVEESISFVRNTGARPMLVEYSPIPHTPLFEKAKRASSFDLENEPLFHNNSILPCQWEGFTVEDYRRLKEQLRRK